MRGELHYIVPHVATGHIATPKPRRSRMLRTTEPIAPASAQFINGSARSSAPRVFIDPLIVFSWIDSQPGAECGVFALQAAKSAVHGRRPSLVPLLIAEGRRLHRQRDIRGSCHDESPVERNRAREPQGLKREPPGRSLRRPSSAPIAQCRCLHPVLFRLCPDSCP